MSIFRREILFKEGIFRSVGGRSDATLVLGVYFFQGVQECRSDATLVLGV